MTSFVKYIKKHRKAVVVFSLSIVVFLFLGALFINYTWRHEVEKKEITAMKVAQAAAAGLSADIGNALEEGFDENGTQYIYLKNTLSDIAAINEDIRFAYIYAGVEGEIYILVDSEPADSEDYSPPWQLYDEADEVMFSPLEGGGAVITKPYEDRWGTWVSALVPIKDKATGEVTAAFGIDYYAGAWYGQARHYTAQAAFVVSGAVVIIIGIFILIAANKELSADRLRLLELGSKLRESSGLFRSVFDQADIGIAIVHNFRFTLPSEDGVSSMNRKFEEILGRSNEELSKINWPDITHKDDLAADLELFRKFRSGQIDRYELEKRFLKPDGQVVWVRMIVSPLRLGSSNSEQNHLCIIEDIGKNRELENTLRESERSKAVLLDNLPGMFYSCNYDSNWTMQSVSNGFFELTGYAPESILNNRDMSFNEIIVPEYREYLFEKWKSVIARRGKLTVEYEIICADGQRKWVWEQGQGVYGESGEVVALEGLVLDITDRKNNEIKLKYQTEHETLTGLLNFRSFEERFSKRKREKESALLLINVRKFSLINSALGYHTGRKLIYDIAKCLEQFASEDRLLFQMSADRFLFYITKNACKSELNKLGGRIIAALDAGVFLKTAGFCIGVLEIPRDSGDSTEDALKKVYITAENAGENERFGCRFFNEEMEKRIQRENIVTKALTNAAYKEHDESLYMEYQPIVDLKTGRICNFEALARLKNDELGTVSPGEFIQIAESSQLMLPLGKRIMRLVFNFSARLAQLGLSSISLSLNVSAIQFQNEAFLTEVKSLLDETGADPGRIRVELTESVFIGDLQAVNTKIDEIKRLGMKIALDDFGTGYSSLSRLIELRLDYLKIDKEFIDEIKPENQNETIFGDIISMAHKLGCEVVAEGVENEEQMRALSEFHCDMVQGYFCGRPTDENEALELLRKQNLKKPEKVSVI